MPEKYGDRASDDICKRTGQDGTSMRSVRRKAQEIGIIARILV
jgi:hypothetical protein